MNLSLFLKSQNKMRNQNNRPSPPRTEHKPFPNAREKNLCFRCLKPLDENKKELKEDFYCEKCFEVMRKVLEGS